MFFSDSYDKGETYMKTVAFGNFKGGTGKTSNSVSVAAILARNGNKVLLVDGDPQGNASSWLLKDISAELADVMAGKCYLGDAVHHTFIENFDIIPTYTSSDALRKYTESEALNSPFAFCDLKEVAESLGYDFLIYDTAPSFSPLEKTIFISVDEFIGVLQLDYFSADGLEGLLSSLTDLKKKFRVQTLNLSKLVLTMKDERIKIQKKIFEQIETMKEKGFELFILPVEPAYKKAQATGSLIEDWDPKPEIKRELRRLAETLEALDGDN